MPRLPALSCSRRRVALCPWLRAEPSLRPPASLSARPRVAPLPRIHVSPGPPLRVSLALPPPALLAAQPHVSFALPPPASPSARPRVAPSPRPTVSLPPPLRVAPGLRRRALPEHRAAPASGLRVSLVLQPLPLRPHRAWPLPPPRPSEQSIAGSASSQRNRRPRPKVPAPRVPPARAASVSSRPARG